MHEFCVTFARTVNGEAQEVHHRHVEAEQDEHAAIAAAMEAAREGIDVSDCDVMIKVIKVLPSELKRAIKLVLALNDFTKVEQRAADHLSRESIEKGVADSVGGVRVGAKWEFPSQHAEAEFYRRLLGILDTATPAPQDTGKPKTNLH